MVPACEQLGGDYTSVMHVKYVVKQIPPLRSEVVVRCCMAYRVWYRNGGGRDNKYADSRVSQLWLDSGFMDAGGP